MQIPISGFAGAGRYAICDADDYPNLMQHKWYFREGYALTKIRGKEVRMHRYVMRTEDPSIIIDHINRNRLDNRKENLRPFTLIENANNRVDNVMIDCFGESKTIADWVRDDRCVVSYNVLRGRLYRGVPAWASILAGEVSDTA